MSLHEQPVDSGRLIHELSDSIDTLEARASALKTEANVLNAVMANLAELKRRASEIATLELNGYPLRNIDIPSGQARRLALIAARMDALWAITRSQRTVASHRISKLSLPRRYVAGDARQWPELTALEKERLRDFLEDWSLFHSKWYKKEYSIDQSLSDLQAIEHYLDVGITSGFDPHPLFSSWFLASQSDKPAESAPLLRYADDADIGEPFPLFDADFYRSKYWDVASASIHAYKHYIKYGSAEGRQPHVAFEPKWYNTSRLASNDADLLIDYITHPSSFRLSPHPLFDAKHYLGLLPELIESNTNPLVHYLVHGEHAGLSPHPLFEPDYYMSFNSDLLIAGVRPFEHFLIYGDREFRQPHPLFVPSYYDSQAAGIFGPIEQPLRHYVTAGAARKIPASRQLEPQALLEAMPEAFESLSEPISSFIEGKGLSYHVSPTDVLRSKGSAQRKAAGIADEDISPVLKEYTESIYGSKVRIELEGMLRPILKLGDLTFDAATNPDFLDIVQDLKAALEDYEAPSDIEVSFIIPVYNQVLYTAVCILSILRWMPRGTFEILIGDDRSTDGTEEIFRNLGGPIRVVRHERNLGFLLNCNETASSARGEFLMLLNNDTVVLPSAIDTLLDYAKADKTAAIIGSKLLNSDGSLQEAGGILWNDGSGWNFGRGGNPGAAPFNYVKDVDYISGAAILVRRSVWIETGGFDEIYVPAYCEDSDLAFRARALGYRVVYHPHSEVIHHEGRSHGRDILAGIKKYQVENNKKLYDRWALTLLRENLPYGQQAFVARDRSRDRPHLLVVDHYVPQWDRDAGSRTMFNFLQAFIRRGFKIIFWSDNLYRDPDYTRPLQALGVEVIYGMEFSGRFESWFAERAVWIPYVLLSRPHISTKYIDIIKSKSSAKIIYYGHDLHWARLANEKAITGRTDMDAAIQEIRDLEYRLAALSDVVMYPSEEEKHIVSSMFDGRKSVLAVPAWFFDPDFLREKRQDLTGRANGGRNRLLFVGGFAHGPNVDAVHWFVEQVVPHLKRMAVDFELLVAGSNPPASLRELLDPAVRVLGRVDDAELAELYASSTLAIVPLRFGGGVKGKVIEAFANGLPVVSSSVGMQGIPDGDELAFVADDPLEFAEQVARALSDDDLARGRARAALEFVGDHYTMEIFFSRLSETVPEFRAL